jgi:hypothetical protein
MKSILVWEIFYEINPKFFKLFVKYIIPYFIKENFYLVG